METVCQQFVDSGTQVYIIILIAFLAVCREAFIGISFVLQIAIYKSQEFVDMGAKRTNAFRESS